MIVKWIRWLIFGKRLDEILDEFVQKQQELVSFKDRTDRRIEKTEETLQRLQEQQNTMREEADRAKMVRENLHTMLTTLIVPQQPPPPQEPA